MDRFNEYQLAARKTAHRYIKACDDIAFDATTFEPDEDMSALLRVSYSALGLAGEAGEYAGKVKKLIRDGCGEETPESRLKLIDELGDVLWYVAACASELNVTLSDVAQRNIDKLRDRDERGVLGGSGDSR